MFAFFVIFAVILPILQWRILSTVKLLSAATNRWHDNSSLQNATGTALRLWCRLWQTALQDGGVVKLLRIPGGQSLPNSRLKSKGDIASKHSLALHKGQNSWCLISTMRQLCTLHIVP